MPKLVDYRQYIEAALEYANGSHTFQDVSDALDRGELQSWFGPHSVIITEIIQFPQYRALNFFLAGGDMHELEAMYTGVEKWGAAQGCVTALLTGRRGWERSFLKGLGWKPSESVTFEKKL